MQVTSPSLSQEKPVISEETVAKWQNLVNLMARACQVPVGLIMKVEKPYIEVFVRSATEGNPYERGEKASLNTGLYCERVIEQRVPLLVPDALKDPEWDHNPDIKLGLTYYLGFPIAWPDGDIFGTICILDYKDNPHATDQKELMAEFSQVVERDLRIIIQGAERERLLREKELLLKEIHHRVKGNLNIVSSLLALSAAGYNDPRLQEAFRESQNRIRSIALVHEKLYGSADLASIDFGLYLKAIVAVLFESSARKGISFRMDCDEIRLEADEAVPLALVTNELVLNALKYAFPGDSEGEVAIELRSGDKGKIVMTVRDNGKGFPEHLDFRNSPSLGLQLVNDLVKQIGGTITMAGESGTVFTIQW
ncbi:MAG: histidine kinase dimerization/phosphoacceptor domain -containing protein [Candidatus Eremiobacteraeota bacterium]|nr:histidine kinase dimerization/phosphoacceptor domain -containing protein [Candidatus Eremiobacteraeota bacterium]